MNNAAVNFDSYCAFSLEQKLQWHIKVWSLPAEQFQRQEMDMEGEMLAVLDALEEKGALQDIEQLCQAVRRQPELYAESCQFYFVQTMLLLYLNQSASFEQLDCLLEPFYVEPTAYFDIFSSVLDKLLCFDQSQLAVELCKKTYHAIAVSTDFLYNPKEMLSNIIMVDELQKIYKTLQAGSCSNWPIFEKKMSLLDLDFSRAQIAAFEQCLLGQFEWHTAEKIFEDNAQVILAQLQLLYCCYRYDLDGTSFASSIQMAEEITHMLIAIPEKKGSSLKALFDLKKEWVASYLTNYLGEDWFDRSHMQICLLACLPFFYKFLYREKMVTKLQLKTAVQIAEQLLAEFKAHMTSSWRKPLFSKFFS